MVNQTLLCTLITASHILHQQDLFDAYGHISARNSQNASRFLLSEDIPPALVSSTDQIIEYNVADSQPVDPNESRSSYLERFIHGEIYRKFPDVAAVVHSHSSDVLPWTISGVPLRAVSQSGFLGKLDHEAPHVQNKTDLDTIGKGVPVWDQADYDPSNHNLLVYNQELGTSLADKFEQGSDMVTGDGTDMLPEPFPPVVLMRGHGFTTTAADIKRVVFQAIYTKLGAQALERALGIHAAVHGSSPNVTYLSDEEIVGVTNLFATPKVLQRSWQLFERQVQIDPLYVNDVDPSSSTVIQQTSPSKEKSGRVLHEL